MDRRLFMGASIAALFGSSADAASFRQHKRLHKGSAGGGGGGGAAPAITLDWPWAWSASGIDAFGYGSSTMAGHGNLDGKDPLRSAFETTTLTSTHFSRVDANTAAGPASGGSPMFINHAASSGGAPSVTMNRMTLDMASGALPSTTALIFTQYAADWAAASDTTSDNATKAVAYAAATVLPIPSDPTMARTAFWSNKQATSGDIGSDAYYTNEKFVRRMHAAGYRTIDPMPFFRSYDTGVPTDTTQQQRWNMPPSLMADASHTNNEGSRLLGVYTLAPWLATKANPEWLLIHDRRYWSQETTNQTNGGKVCDLAYEGAVSGTVGATVDNTDFKVTFDGPSGAPVLRRNSSTFLGALYYRLAITYWRDSIDPADGVLKRFRRVASVVVWLQRTKGQDAGAYKAIVGQQVLRGEWRSPDGVLTSTGLTVCICIEPQSGWDAALDGTVGGLRLFLLGGSGATLTLGLTQGSNGGRVNLALNNGAAFSFNSPPTLVREVNGKVWLWFWVDFSGGVFNSTAYGGAYHQQWASSGVAGTFGTWAGSHSGTVTPPASANPLNLFADNGGMAQFFGADASGNGTAPLARVAVWMARSKVDPSTYKDSFRNSSTLRSALDVGGRDGVVNGVSPFYWSEGSAANLTLNMANPLDHWVCSDWADRTAPATLAA